MRVRCSDDEDDGIMDLSQALEHTSTDEELIFNPQEKSTMATRKATAQPATPVPTAAPTPTPAPTRAQKRRAAPVEPQPEPEPTTERAPRAVPEGHIGLADLSAQLGVPAASMRRRLRTMEGMTKPEGQHGWYWKEGSKELATVRQAFAQEPAAAK